MRTLKLVTVEKFIPQKSANDTEQIFSFIPEKVIVELFAGLEQISVSQSSKVIMVVESENTGRESRH
jgi:hypothetical protein